MWAPGCDKLVASQPGTHCACASSAELHEWSCSLLGPFTCPKKLQGRHTPSAYDCLGDRTGSGSGYLSNSGTRPPKVPILNGERGSSP
ncbi:unnamed protein product [Staurois parvus]|uniref:Uncharacterized protein n=1 Tax=Staurois parvus TaxID=386267 RepID=A0ABN9F6C0_9NEOB|nr:unnamed protein product [Staurois parvus]